MLGGSSVPADRRCQVARATLAARQLVCCLSCGLGIASLGGIEQGPQSRFGIVVVVTLRASTVQSVGVILGQGMTDRRTRGKDDQREGKGYSGPFGITPGFASGRVTHRVWIGSRVLKTAAWVLLAAHYAANAAPTANIRPERRIRRFEAASDEAWSRPENAQAADEWPKHPTAASATRFEIAPSHGPG
ncbi:MAG: hypothetical protein FJ189_09895 [Gammaproteobacteria bacterium]|nr:hypothetical protein [Gammaproteobacteria bacterium]